MHVSEREFQFIARAIAARGGEANRCVRGAVIRWAEDVNGEPFDSRRTVVEPRTVVDPPKADLSNLLLSDPTAAEERLVSAVVKRLQGKQRRKK